MVPLHYTLVGGALIRMHTNLYFFLIKIQTKRKQPSIPYIHIRPHDIRPMPSFCVSAGRSVPICRKMACTGVEVDLSPTLTTQ